ncbi:uncharacterized protein DS421_14g469860 [Arachis hypogaea]|nr:uncharacterized protein DS421_14g469860 [Arachis hypogaea]
MGSRRRCRSVTSRHRKSTTKREPRGGGSCHPVTIIVLVAPPSSPLSRIPSPPFAPLLPSEKLPWPLPSSSQVREERVAGERERCCTAVLYCAATAMPCRRQSCHHRVPPPLFTVEEKPCLRCCLLG